MKTLAPLRRPAAGIASLLCFLLAVSCQTATVPSAANDIVKLNRSHWVRVSTRPPTYYPRGVPADAPTDHWSGEWLDTDDGCGTRYFIPFHHLGGMDRQTLVKEALSARSERKLAAIAAEDEEILARNIRNTALFGPPVYAGVLLAAMGGASSLEVDTYRLQKEWVTSKQPH